MKGARLGLLAGCLLASVAESQSTEVAFRPVKVTAALRVEMGRIGSGLLAAIAESAKGQLMYSDPDDWKVFVLNPDGSVRWSRGRQGDGPGEFRRLHAGRGGFAGDSVWVFDDRTQRITVFSPSGSLLRSTLLPTVLGGGRDPNELSDTTVVLRFTPRSLAADGQLFGSALFGTIKLAKHGDDEPEPTFSVDRSSYATLPARTTRPRELFPTGNTSSSVEIRTKGGSAHFTIPFTQDSITSLSPNARFLATLDNIIVQSGRGRPIMRVRNLSTGAQREVVLPLVPRPVTPAQRDKAVAQYVGSAKMVPESMKAQAAKQMRTRVPKLHPVVSSLVVGDDGTALLSAMRADGTRAWVLVSNTGVVRGALAVPATSFPRVVTATHVWMSDSDDDGMAILTKYLLTP